MAHPGKRYLTAALAVLAYGSAFGQHSHSLAQAEWGRNMSGWKLLQHSMEVARTLPVEATIFRQKSPRSNLLMEMQFEQSGDGDARYEILSPLSLRGIINLDDGHVWTNYHPDDQEVTVQPSPRENLEDPNFRIRLAEKNYSVKMEASTEIAGRRAITLIATPKFPEMSSRRYSIDQRKEYLLRMEILDHGHHRTILDTKAISFPDEVPESHFEFTAPRGAHFKTLDAPRPLDRESKQSLGFKPAIPSNLPFGFVVQDRLVGGQKKCEFLSIKLTDGLASATVYQANEKCAAKMAKPYRFDKEVKGVRFWLVGEVPESVWKQLIDAFVKEALKGLESEVIQEKDPDARSEEPHRPSDTLNWEQKKGPKPSKKTASDAEPLDIILSLVEIDA